MLASYLLELDALVPGFVSCFRLPNHLQFMRDWNEKFNLPLLYHRWCRRDIIFLFHSFIIEGITVNF